MTSRIQLHERMGGLHRNASLASFSLVEVVLSLAVVSFALVSIMGLLSVGLTTNKVSSDQIQASNIASLLVSARRSSPTNVDGNFTTFALPHLNQLYTTNTVQVGLDGTTSTTTGTTYNLFYGVGTNYITGSNLARIYLLIWWPLSAKMPTNNPSSYYELSTTVSLQ